MTLSFTGRKRIRKNFGRIQTLTTMPNLIEVQKTSYDHFLQQDTPAESRGAWGLQDVFDSVFPILDFSERTELSFVKYEFDKPKYDVEECQQRGMTYAAPLRVTLRLTVLDVDEETGAQSVRDIKEQDVYFSDIPFMTDKVRLLLMEQSVSLLAKCIGLQEFSLTTIRGRHTPPESYCLLLG